MVVTHSSALFYSSPTMKAFQPPIFRWIVSMIVILLLLIGSSNTRTSKGMAWMMVNDCFLLNVLPENIASETFGKLFT